MNIDVAVENAVKAIDVSWFPLKLEFLDIGSRVSGWPELSVRVHVPDRDDRTAVRHIYFHFSSHISALAWNEYMRGDCTEEDWRQRFIRELYMFCRQVILHEFSESFLVDGQTYDDPHKDRPRGTLRHEVDPQERSPEFKFIL